MKHVGINPAESKTVGAYRAREHYLQTVGSILDSFGWHSVDIGGIEGARLLEPLCLLWVAYMMQSGNPNHALKMLHR